MKREVGTVEQTEAGFYFKPRRTCERLLEPSGRMAEGTESTVEMRSVTQLHGWGVEICQRVEREGEAEVMGRGIPVQPGKQ